MSLVKYHKLKVHPFLKHLSALLCCALFISANQNLRAQTSNENEVKAVFIFNFTHFVKWPSSAFNNSNSPFVIGIIGKKVGSYLEETIEGEKVDTHPIVVRYFDEVSNVDICHIIFIENPSNTVVRNLITHLRHKPVLMVSDAENFMKDGGHIRLYQDQNKIRLEINHEKLIESNLEISAKLLSLATIYKSR